MKALNHIEAALKDIDEEVNALVMHPTMAMNEKDAKMLSLLQQKRVLEQTRDDLIYLRDNPPAQAGCGMSRYRTDD